MNRNVSYLKFLNGRVPRGELSNWFDSLTDLGTSWVHVHFFLAKSIKTVEYQRELKFMISTNIFLVSVLAVLSITLIVESQHVFAESWYMVLVDWNRNGMGDFDDADPLLFSLTDKPAKTIRAWPEWHDSRKTYLDLYDVGTEVPLSRILDEGTMTMFIDLNQDGTLSDGTEWLFDQNENVLQILERKLIDSNQNGWFDYSDDLWYLAMIKDGSMYYHASDLGILGFNWSIAEHYEDDFVGKGRYSDCLYEGVDLFSDCKPVSEAHFRIQAHNSNGILLEGGRIIHTFGGLMGQLDMRIADTASDNPE